MKNSQAARTSSSITKKALILFGAGASYGMGGKDSRPPLGDSLFDSLANNFKDTWGALDMDQRVWFNDCFETGMARLKAEGEVNNVPFTQYCKDMAVFFSGFDVTDKSNLYCQLIRSQRHQLLRGDLILATLNYDCLIERASQRIFEKNLIGYRSGEGPLRLLKIHGSCNFIIDHPSLIIKGQVNVTGGSMIGYPLRILDSDISGESIRREKFQPVMSVYARGKDTLVGTDLVKGFRDEYAEKVLESDLVAVVGVRPNDYDRHIWDPICQTAAKVVMIDPGDEAKDWFDNNLASGTNKFYKHDFRNGLGVLIKELNS